MQLEHANKVPLSAVILTIIPLVIASISYSLGNYKMMQLVNGAYIKNDNCWK